MDTAWTPHREHSYRRKIDSTAPTGIIVAATTAEQDDQHND
jgi:hypothetical protein